jgi:ribosomal protein S18 acetylase RimI-like enzyme
VNDATRRFGRLTGRAPRLDYHAFLEALYLASRPDLGALPVPRGVIEAIARHQRQLQLDDYGARYPQAETWVLEEQGQPVARLVLDCSADVLRVVDLAVASGARRRGIARAALQALQQESRGRRGITLRVRRENTEARSLYEAEGFLLRSQDSGGLELGWSWPELG